MRGILPFEMEMDAYQTQVHTVAQLVLEEIMGLGKVVENVFSTLDRNMTMWNTFSDIVFQAR